MGETPKGGKIQSGYQNLVLGTDPLPGESYNGGAVMDTAAELFALNKPHGRKLGKVVLPQSHLSGCQ